MSFFQGTNGVSIGQGTFNAVTGNQRQKKKRTVYDEFPDIQRGFVRRLEDLDHKDRLLGWNSRLRKYEAKIHDDSSSNNIYNHYTISKREKKNRRIYDEFPDIQRGLVRRLKDLDHKDCLLRWNSRLRKCEVRVKGTISTVKIHGDSSSFTVMPYKGQDAQKVWKKEFQQFSETTNTTKIQLFGINRSRIPLLIFHGELVPLAHLWDRLGRSYAYELAYNMECKESEMWIDPAQGTLIRGAERPDFDLLDRFRFPPIGTLPSTVELLDENVCFRYFSRLPLDKEFDKGIIHMLHYASKIEEKISSIISKPCVFSSKTNPMIAVGRGQWRVFGCLNHSGVAMPDGRTRFTITDESSELSFHSDTFGDMRAWLSQASSVFNRLGISLDEELSSYELVVPSIVLSGSIKNSSIKHQRCSEDPPIYFFLHPLPSFPLGDGSVLSTHTWSYDENGETPFTHHHCEYLGLPTELSLYFLSETHHWRSETYKSIHKWQVARGFDPTTSDFARCLEYPIYEVLPESEEGRFEELNIGSSGRSPAEESSSYDNIPQ